ncbi:MAG: ATP-binding protein [Bacteroidota bacterium]
MNTIKRTLEDTIKQYLIPNKVILLFGARRVGKTVMLKRLMEAITGRVLYLNGEDFDTMALLANRSIANYHHLFQNVDLLIIDEAQNIPDIGKILKLIADEITGLKIIASGSSSFDLLNKTGEPLVGRSSTFILHPFSQLELSVKESLLEMRQNLESRLIYGTYPEVVMLGNFEQKCDYLKEIVNAYLLKDILSVDGIRNDIKMKYLLRLIAFQTSNEVSYDELGRQLGMSKNTVIRYLDLLSKTFVIFRLGAYAKNLRKEVSKAGKYYFYDTGIRNAVISDFKPLSIRQDVGALWENYLIVERIKQNANLKKHNEYYFWRTYDKQEIDLIEEESDTIRAFEFKWSKINCHIPAAFANAYPQAEYNVINKDNYQDFIL